MCHLLSGAFLRSHAPAAAGAPCACSWARSRMPSTWTQRMCSPSHPPSLTQRPGDAAPLSVAPVVRSYYCGTVPCVGVACLSSVYQLCTLRVASRFSITNKSAVCGHYVFISLGKNSLGVELLPGMKNGCLIFKVGA